MITGMPGPWLLHGLVESGMPLPALPDLCRTDVRHGPGAGLSILLTPIGAEGATALAQAEGAAALAMTHHALLASLCAQIPVLPVRFPALCDTPAAAVRAITARGAEFRALIAQLGDGAEYGLRVLAPPRAPAPAPPGEAAGGSAWLRAAARRRQGREDRGAARAALIDGALTALAPLATATAPGKPAGLLPDGRQRLAECAYLVPRPGTAAFLARAAAVAADLGAAGLLADLSGPWPAYSFATPGVAP